MNYREEQIKHKIKQDFKTMLYSTLGIISMLPTKLSLWMLGQSVKVTISRLEVNKWYANKMMEVTYDNSWLDEIAQLDEMIDELKLMLS